MQINNRKSATLGSPASYLPFLSGRYEVKAGLFKLGHEFGNGPADNNVFQIDSSWIRYREQKLLARNKDLNRYVCRGQIRNDAEKHLVKYLCEQYAREYPEYFQVAIKNNSISINCALSRETLHLDSEYALIACDGNIPPVYSSSLDALACQVQEDLAFMDNGSRSRLCWLHLCFPNHWSAQDKIGKDFVAIHEPVPEMEQINARAQALMASLAEQGPYVRFAWGLSGDPELDCHPIQTGDRNFSENGPLYIRVERQVIVPMMGHGFLFAIRTYMVDSSTLSKDDIRKLHCALQNMSTASKLYKGIAGHERAIFRVLERNAAHVRI